MPNPHRTRRNKALGVLKRAKQRRRDALKRGDWKQAQGARKVMARARTEARAALHALRLSRSPTGPPPVKKTFMSVKRWFSRPFIKPDLVVLHSTESSAHSGYNVSDYLSRGSVQADSHLVIDTDGTTYRLVPDGRKAWTQQAYNSRSLSIEQVGRASQTSWPDVQVRATARWIAFWGRKYNIPVRDSRKDLKSGVTTHKGLGAAGGGHHDPGESYPFTRVINLARRY